MERATLRNTERDGRLGVRVDCVLHSLVEPTECLTSQGAITYDVCSERTFAAYTNGQLNKGVQYTIYPNTEEGTEILGMLYMDGPQATSAIVLYCSQKMSGNTTHSVVNFG